MLSTSKPVGIWSVHSLSAFCYLTRATAFHIVVTWAEQQPFNLLLPKPSNKLSTCCNLSLSTAFRTKPLNLFPEPCHSLSTSCYLIRATAFSLLLTEPRPSLLNCCYLSRAPAFQPFVTPILHSAWLNNHALTLKSNTAKYYFGEKSSFLHTFLKFCCESRKI